jgi:hypothetical protein
VLYYILWRTYFKCGQHASFYVHIAKNKHAIVWDALPPCRLLDVQEELLHPPSGSKKQEQARAVSMLALVCYLTTEVEEVFSSDIPMNFNQTIGSFTSFDITPK